MFNAFAAWKGSRPFGWTVQRKIIVARAKQLGANVAAEMNVRIWENFSTRAGAYREGLKVSQIPQDVGWVAVGQMVVAKGRERRVGVAW